MTALPRFSVGDRLLVFAPHPDDETLATGELIQCAIASGAGVRIVFATDGDNNPWPQRWMEKRWHIGAAQRASWGARRRREAVAALAQLGIDRGDCVRFLGWPDQGLTDCLMRDGLGVDLLLEEIGGFMPTHVAMPTLADRHPDHSALRVMLELALVRSSAKPVRLGYVVHGTQSADVGRGNDVARKQKQRKQQALRAYASQMSLSRRRLLALAERAEEFELSEPSPPLDGVATIRIPYRFNWATRRRHDLLLVIATAQETLRLCAPLPATSPTNADAQGRAFKLETTPDALQVTLPVLSQPLLAVFAKIHRAGPRLVIFDHQSWQQGADLLRGSVPIADRQAAAGFT